MNNSLYLPRNIKAGVGCLEELGDVVKDLKGTHAFIVIDAFLAKEPLNYHLKIKDRLDECDLKVTFFSEFQGEPSTHHLKVALSQIDSCQADCVVGIGGGSAIDLAKAVSVFAFNKDVQLDDIENIKNLERLPLIAIPTTAGTGSEATKVMVITDVDRNIKRNPGNPKLIPDVAILDANLSVSLPKHFTAYTGLDALAHALEAYVSTRATEMSDKFALEAIRMIGEALPTVYANGDNLQSRQTMLIASCYAGIAFSNASTNLAHATARPLGAIFHIPHGLSVALLLPYVIEFGLEVAEERYATIAKALGSKLTESRELAKDSLAIVRNFNSVFQIWQDGKKYINNETEFTAAIPLLVKDALSGNGVVTNRLIPTEDDVRRIFEELSSNLFQYSEA